jgi:outer membrane protein assembly factor BamD (BamD/ComL family)
VGLALLLASSTAPYQCSSRQDPKRAMEEEPSEALYHLAETFHTQGDEGARETTLRTIVARYPSTRWAEMAKQDLAAMGKPAAVPTAN